MKKGYIIKLDKSASVVTLDYAREILWHLDYKAVRIEDDLNIYPMIKGDEYGSLFIKEKDRPKKINALYVDEGMFSYCLKNNGEIMNYNNPWGEVVDYQGLLAIIAQTLVPDCKVPSSSAIGRGRHQQDMIEGWHKILERSDKIKFT